MKRTRWISLVLAVLMAAALIPSTVLASDLPFTDVPESAWYYNDVKTAYDSGLINGVTPTNFEPNSNMTYAQAVKLAACMNQLYLNGEVTLTNGSPNWWDSYVTYAKENGIIDKDYEWKSNATRAEYVEIFARALPEEALRKRNNIADGYIPDVTMEHPQAQSIYMMYRAGILTGMDSQGTFQPDSNIRRSEVAAVLTRMMNEDARKELTFGPVTFTVTFDSAGGSNVEAQTVEENAKASKPTDPTKTGFTFGGWFTDSALTVAYDFNTPVAADITLYAKWNEVPVNYTVNFDSAGGSSVEAQTVAKNAKASKPADPAKTGFTFGGWFTDSALTVAYDFNTPVTADITLYAKWNEAPITYTVTFYMDGGSAVPAQTVAKNAKASKPADPTKGGYDFVGWYADSARTVLYDFNTPVTSDVTIYAKWETIKPKYEVDFESNGGSNPAAIIVKEGDKVSKPTDPTKDGYSFAGWYTDSALTALYDFNTPVTANITLYAKWKVVGGSHTVTFDTAGGSEVPAQTVADQGKAIKPADPTFGEDRFIGWFTDSERTMEYNFSNPVTDDLTLYALFLDHFWMEWVDSNETIKDSWEMILASIDNGTYKTKYKVGDTKFLYSGPRKGFLELQIAGFDMDELADGSGKAAITWISVYKLTDHRMNPAWSGDYHDYTTGGTGGWEYSELRAWLPGYLLPLIPELVRNEIKEVKKYSSVVDMEDLSTIAEILTTDTVWIPSYREGCGGISIFEPSGVSYSELFKTADDRIRKEDYVSSHQRWWLRSCTNDLCQCMAVWNYEGMIETCDMRFFMGDHIFSFICIKPVWQINLRVH